MVGVNLEVGLVVYTVTVEDLRCVSQGLRGVHRAYRYSKIFTRNRPFFGISNVFE